MRSLRKSSEHFQKTLTRLPLGVSSNFRYWGDDKTICVKRGKGVRLRDIDDDEAPADYRDWVNTNYDFYDALAPQLHELGILVEPDSREPWFRCEAHDVKSLEETLDKFEQAVEITMKKLPAERNAIKTA